MTYYRNGFLEGLDGAAKIMNMYHGIRDRQEQREWKQKEWDYRVGQDKKTWDFRERQQDHLEKHQTASLNETIRAHKANEGIAAGHLNLARTKYNDALRKEREQEQSDAMFISGYNGEDSGITSKDIGSLPYAIKGSFNGLGNYAAQKFGLGTPEGASPNGVFGVLDDKKGNVIIGYLDNANGQKRVHTVGEAMTKEQAVKMLKESGASDDHINILLGNEVKQGPTEDTLTKGIDFGVIEKLKRERDAKTQAANADPWGAVVLTKDYDKLIAAEQAKIDAQKQRNLEEFNKNQAETDAKERQYTADINKAIVNGKLADVSERKNLARLDTLAAAYPKATKETKKLILEEAEAIRGSGLASGLSGPELVSQYRKDKQIKEAQTKGLLSGIEARSKDIYTTNTEHSNDRAKAKLVRDVEKDILDSVSKNYDTKSGKRGQAAMNTSAAMAYVAEKAGGFTNKLVNSHEFKLQASKLVKAMTDKGFEDPAAGYYYLQRHGGGSSSISETEINAISQAFANARQFGTDSGLSNREMNDILRTTTDIMAQGKLDTMKFEEVFHSVIDSRRGGDGR